MSTVDIKNINYFFQMSQTRNGIKFDPNEDKWDITDANRKIRIDFNKLNFNKDSLFGLKNTMKLYFEYQSARHAENMYKLLKNLCDYIFDIQKIKISKITDIDLINFRSYIGKEREWYLGSLSGFLKKWYKMGNSCLTKEAYGYLEETKFKSNSKGVAVLTMDPIHGPFTDLELESIQSAINNSYAKNKIKTEDYILVWLFMIYGSRPIQFAQLKVKDVIAVKQKENDLEVFLNIPRVKNRKVVRSEFKRRLVPVALASLLKDYSNNIKERVKNILTDPREAPLFIGKKLVEINDENNHVMNYHQTSADIEQKLKNILKVLQLKSERTNDYMHITPTRFRRTIGTRAAIEGHGSLIIAEILDHTDTQNAQIYVEATPEIIERIDRRIALELAPIAQAFAGTLVKDKTKAIRADDPEADIINPSADKTCTPTGKCGSYSFCGQMSPLACYTCSSFQAWTDGPHEAVLEYLIKERNRLLEVADYRIASVNDKTIMAVAQVVATCRSYKNKNEIEVIVDVTE